MAAVKAASGKQKLVHDICRRLPAYDPEKAPARRTLSQRLLGRVLHEILRRDPSMTLVTRLNGAELEMPADHTLVSLLTTRPLYESELYRLLSFTAADRAPLKVIDVGANIGDTRARAPRDLDAGWLCIEAHPLFFDLLQRNCRGLMDVCLERSAVSDHDATERVRFHEHHGTASITQEGPGADGGVTVEARTIDKILERHPRFADAAVLKTDTDGFEQKVLRGAEAYLRRTKPRIHFECMSRHWRHSPGDTPTDDLNILSGFGYDTFLFYEEYGYLFGVDADGSRATCAALEAYTDAKRWSYWNVIAFHRDEAGAAERFLSGERAFFADT